MEKVLHLINDNNLVKKGDVVAVATSGGSDSMALLNLLKTHEKELGIEVISVHVNHGIRENAKRDEDFVKRFCKKNNIRFYCFNIDVPKIAKEKGISLESAGRQARYGVFDAVLSKKIANKIALAHHERDQVETILMHLFRGSGLGGVVGMQVNSNNYIRPLLNVSKDEILNYIKEQNLQFVEDETNAESTYNRNFIRNEILPKLKEKWPKIEKNLINFSNFATEDDNFIQKSINMDACLFEENIAKMPLTYFSYDVAQINRIIFKCFKKIGVFVDIEAKHIDLIKKLAMGDNGKKINLPMNVTVIKEYDYITITNKTNKNNTLNRPFKCEEFSVPNFGVISVKRVNSFSKGQDGLYIDQKLLPKSAVWRYKKEGDVFTKLGGGTKKLKDYFIDKKIPSRLRSNIPVLADKNEVFVIAGVAISDKVKIMGNEKSVIKIAVK